MKRKYDIDDELENVDLSEHIKNARWIEKKPSGRKKLAGGLALCCLMI